MNDMMYEEELCRKMVIIQHAEFHKLDKIHPGPWHVEPMTSKKARRGSKQMYRIVDSNNNNVCHYIIDRETADIIAAAGGE